MCDINANCHAIGGYGYCLCMSGYIGNGVICNAPNPCDVVDICGENTFCVNHLDGTYTCECDKAGFERVGEYLYCNI